MVSYKTVAGVFSQISEIYDRFLSFVSWGRIHAWQRRLVELTCKGDAVLDIGTGTGEVLLKAKARAGRPLVGLDPADGMISVAKRKCRECFFVIGLGENLPFRDGVFGSVTLSLVFRHLQDQRAFLAEAKRVLKRGGRVGILDVSRFMGTGFLVFLMGTLIRPIGQIIFGRDKWDFFIHSIRESHTPQEVKEMLEDAGFGQIQIEKRLFGLIHIIVGVKTA